ncbi:pancreatic triacylglycerol lipase-like [Linepithema humile]|uniref:pancreatic triacylglycerol lipase-like n=1 Tax=Linepithema humile TaxID=83485 RepID=UPI00351EF254
MIHVSQRFIFAVIIYAAATSAEPVEDNITDSIFLRLYAGSLDEYIDYSLENDTILSKLIDGKPTVLYIHGFMEHLEKESVRTVIQAYLKRNDHNVIGIDYGKVANDTYPNVVKNAFNVGTTLAETLDKLVALGFDARKLHVVGHSMGAQIAGIVGREVSFRIPRITGLDPAGPLFNILMPRLSSSDASMVDIIHTDYGFYGIGRSTGTVDFFPNNGVRVQPGCPLNTTFYSDEDFCSHHRSWRYYAESLTDESAFLGVQCPSPFSFISGGCNNNTLIAMGYGTPITAKGSVYLVTSHQSPFALEKGHINIILPSF